MQKNSQDKHFYFEVLATDISGNVIFSNEFSFYQNLVSNNKVFKNAKLENGYLLDKEIGIRIEIKKTEDQNNLLSGDIKQAYIITISGTFVCLEPFRMCLISYLKDLKFDSVYILEDGVSIAIASRIYSSIYKVESFLRKYVIKFFALKIGPEWWKLTADTEMQKKTNLRKNNETEFSRYINNEVYLIDFGELGKLIYSQSSGNLNREDVVNKILNLQDNVEALKKFKQEIQTNYNKFFKETFKENNFQQDWEELEKIRHKVAHHSLFTKYDQDRSVDLVSNLIKTIDLANKEIDSISFSEHDKESIISNVLNFENINEEVFVKELEHSIKWAKESADGFVGLQNFIVNILGSKGYSFESSRDLISELEKKGIVEIYTYNNPQKNERGVAAIRFK